MLTKTSLQAKGIIQANDNVKCILCDGEDESSNHLFFNCKFAHSIWIKWYGWVGVNMVYHEDPCSHLIQQGTLLGNEKEFKSASSLWIYIVWSIWQARNELIFNGVNPSLPKIWEEIKARTWSWLNAKHPVIKNVRFGEWNKNPTICR